MRASSGNTWAYTMPTSGTSSFEVVVTCGRHQHSMTIVGWDAEVLQMHRIRPSDYCDDCIAERTLQAMR